MSLAVIRQGTTADTKTSDNDDLSFPAAFDDSEAIREKMRTDMDNYKRIKEMTIRNKQMSSMKATTTTVESTTIAEISTEAKVDSTTAASPSTSSEPTTVQSSTLLQIAHNLGISSDFEDTEDNSESETTEIELENMTLPPGKNMTIDDRFIIDAPLICKAGTVEVRGKCRKTS